MLIMLSSASFFYRARDFNINGGIFIRSDGNVFIRQTGEQINSNLPEWKMLMASLNMHRIT